MSKRWCLFVTAFALLLAGTTSSAAQESRTQQVQLEQGWNLVSLNVQPDDSSFASVFGSDTDQIDMVKNEQGAVYAPGQGIEQITTWKSGEGYRIYANAVVTLSVSGAPIRPSSMPLVLEEGGNIVPYLSSSAQAVETALGGVGASLVLVENEGGDAYEPSLTSPSLDSLRPGQAYKVYVDQKDTLRYPIVVPTLAEAKGLEGVDLGKTIRVQGHQESGDGGGGLFKVTNSRARTDGGTVFVFDEDVSSEQSSSLSISDWVPYTLPDSNLVWGTLEVRYGPDPEDVWSDLHMHGHIQRFGKVTQNGYAGFVDHKSGEISGSGAGEFLKQANNAWGDGSQECTATYKYATADRRLERIHPPGTFNLAWWGAPKADPSNPVSATPYINWAVNVAKDRYLEGGIDWAYVNIPGEYYYRNLTQILDGVMLRGSGPDRSVPTRSFTTGGKLTLMPGEAAYSQNVNFDPVAEHDIYSYMGAATRSTFSHERNASEKIGFQNLELDGNYLENEEVFTSGNYGNIETYLQNSGDWAAWYTTGAGGRSYQKGLELHINNVYAHGYGGNVFAGTGAGFDSGGSEFDVTGPNGVSKNVHVENAVRNHQVYGLPGTMEDWSVSGLFWGTMFKSGSKANRETTYQNLTIENPSASPYGYNTKDIINPLGLNMTYDGFTIDLSQTDGAESIQEIWNEAKGNYYPQENGNSGNLYKNGTIKLSGTHGVHLVASSSSHAPIKWKNITVEDNGGGMQIGSANYNHTYNYFLENFDLIPQGNYPPYDDSGVYYVFGITGRSLVPSIPVSTRFVFRNSSYQREMGVPMLNPKTGATAPYHPHEHFFIDSQVKNGDGKIIRNSVSNVEPWFRAYFDNTTLDVPTTNTDNFHGHIAAGVIRMRNAQDRIGRTSDAVNQGYSATSTDETNGYALIPTSLMSRPGTAVASTSAGYNVTNVEIANSDGTLRADDNVDEEDPHLKVSVDGTITQGDSFTWTARVTPLNEYQTTGLFVARKEANKSYTNGNGPFTVDLRGVATAQESRDPVIYTASSDNTSIVTADVQGDGYTLKLTEQGTGTATVTVTGEISGVGTTTDTFEISVE